MTHYLWVFGVKLEAQDEQSIAELAELVEELTQYSGVGHKTAANLVKSFQGDLSAVLDADEERLVQVEGVGESTAENLVDKISSEEDRIRRVSAQHDPTLDELEMTEAMEEDVPDTFEDEDDPWSGRMEASEGE